MERGGGVRGLGNQNECFKGTVMDRAGQSAGRFPTSWGQQRAASGHLGGYSVRAEVLVVALAAGSH